MKQHARTILVALLVNLLFLGSAIAQSILKRVDGPSKSSGATSGSAVVRFGSLDINNLWLHVSNDGRRDTTKSSGMTFPLFEGGLLYGDNLLWAAKVIDGRLPEIRTGGGTYIPGVRPGMILSKGIAEDPQSESARVYRFRPDYQNGDLTIDVAASNGVAISSVTSEMVDAMRQSYKKDLSEWPWKKGAPFADKNHNGVMDPGENPGLENAGQVLWFSYNDLNQSVCDSFAGGPPIGLEVQVTLWAYRAPNLDDVIFKRYRLIYKGTSFSSSTARIDSMFLTHWSDPDIGNAGDDLGGCDSTLDLGYAYNGTYNGNDQDRTYLALRLPTPGIGYTILQGPLVPGSDAESGIFDFGTRAGFKNLPMSSCAVHLTGMGDGLNEPWGSRTYFYWNVARGFRPWASGFGIDTSYSFTSWLDHEKKPTKYMYYGDPVSRTGWIASRPSYFHYQTPSLPDWPGGDTRLYMNMGPFTMALGDTQEVLVAIIASPAPTSAENATWLKNRAKYVRAIYPKLGEYVAGFVTRVPENSEIPLEFALNQNFPNPFNPSTHISFTIPHEGQVRLSVFDILGREAKILHQGFLPAGQHTIAWDGRNASGEAAPSGVYLYRLTQGDRQLTRKLLLLR